MKIRYRTAKRISPRSVQNLFRRLEWSDWWSLKDVEWYLSRAVHVVSAWHGRKLVGLGVLTGDGRIDLQLNKLIVDCDYQGEGIGTALLERLVRKAEALAPYWFQTDVCDRRTERLYSRFGFRPNTGQKLLMHGPTWERWGPQALADRRKRKGKA